MTTPNLVQETHIERILSDTLWPEIDMLEAKRAELIGTAAAVQARIDKLTRIAQAAEIERPTYTPDPRD